MVGCSAWILSITVHGSGETAADACVRKIIDVVTEIHESQHMEQAELLHVKLRKTLKEVIDYERKAGDA